MQLSINDILYTKDGRKSGNITIVDTYKRDVFIGGESRRLNMFIGMSDYGNKVTLADLELQFKIFYKTIGKATESHKYFNYKKMNPEEFI